jgi:N-methylhydantoinase B/oxoprolinase/acetone carboxylase alpha subunit
MRTPGSGGFGSAVDRDRSAIARDLADGYVSPQAVERDYGVADAQALRQAVAEDG